jgi:hypothetical protein
MLLMLVCNDKKAKVMRKRRIRCKNIFYINSEEAAFKLKQGEITRANQGRI